MNSELASERHTLPYATAVEPLKRFLKFVARKWQFMCLKYSEADGGYKKNGKLY